MSEPRRSGRVDTGTVTLLSSQLSRPKGSCRSVISPQPPSLAQLSPPPLLFTEQDLQALRPLFDEAAARRGHPDLTSRGRVLNEAAA
jgi:hypothetical protein